MLTRNPMKRVTSLLLLFVFLFGLIGYYGVFWVLSEKAQLESSERLDENRYDDKDAITIKFPLNLPYPIQSKEFERVQGSFHYQGEFYNLVKQKLENDTLYIVCVKDHEKKRLESFFSTITKVSHDQPVNSSAFKLLCSYAKEFESSFSFRIKPSTTLLTSVAYPYEDEHILTNSYPVLTPPPEI
jgi:hypothetical protein